MQNLIKLVSLDQVQEEEPFAVRIDGFPPLVVYQVGNNYFVTDNLCTHGNALLSEGFQEGNIIECPFHGGAFDITTGKPTMLPCVEAIGTYPTQVQDNHVCIEAKD
jgi:ethylbenzene dioxygenase ferredoxin subunit